MVGGAVAHKRVADIQSMTWSFGEVDNTVITNPGLQLGLRYSGQDIKKNCLNGYFKQSKIILLREGFQKPKWKFKMAFAIRRRGPPPSPLVAHFQTSFYPTFFLLQLNPTYMKRILHFKNITFKSSYNWFKIDIHQQLWGLKQ